MKTKTHIIATAFAMASLTLTANSVPANQFPDMRGPSGYYQQQLPPEFAETLRHKVILFSEIFAAAAIACVAAVYVGSKMKRRKTPPGPANG